MTDLKSSDGQGQIVASGHNFEAVFSAQEILKSRRKVLERANQINESREVKTNNRVALFQQFSSQIPTNDLGLPTFIYRPDLIPPDLNDYTGEQKTAVLQAASNSVSYDGGYPILDNGALFWEKFSWEPADSYEMFQRYLDMPLLNAEVTAQFTPNGMSQQDASNRATIQVAVRDITSLSMLYQSPTTTQDPTSNWVDTLREYSVLYCWAVRAKAYDLFIAAAYRKWREQKAYSVEQSHFRISEKLLAKASKELLDRFDDPESLADFKPRDLLDVVSKMASLQRVSVGLSANGDRNGSGADGETPRNASLELTLRTIAKSAGEESRQIQDDNAIQNILDDPDSLVKAQELIIRMNSPQHSKSK